MEPRGARAQPLSGARTALLLAAGLGAAAAVAAFGLGRLPGEMRDFEVYWTAAVRALDAQPLYRAADGHFQFKYLPAFAVTAAPVALLPLPAARAAWFVASVVLLVALVWLSLRALPERRRRAGVLVAVAVVAMGKFYGHELVLGQVNILFAALVAAGIVFAGNGLSGSAALLLVAAVAVKPYAVICLPWIVYIGGRRAAIAAGGGVALLVLWPALFYGVEGTILLHREWWLTVTGSTAPNLTNNDNVSLAGFFAKWFGPTRTASAATALVGAGLILATVVVVRRRRGVPRPATLEGALLLTLVPLLSPQGWDYVFLVATPAVVLFANYDDRLPAPLRWTTWTALAVIGLSLFDLLGRARYAVFMQWSIITLCFVVLVSALAGLRWRRTA